MGMDIFRFNGRPLFFLAVTAICGIYAATGDKPHVALIIAAVAILTAFMTKTWYPYIIAASIVLVVFFVYAEIVEKHMDLNFNAYDNTDCMIRGHVSDVVAVNEDYTALYVNPGGLLRREKVKLYIFDTDLEYLRGDIVTVSGKLHKPARRTNPGGYDERKALFADGVSAKLYADGGDCDITGSFMPLKVFGIMSRHISSSCVDLLGRDEGGVLAGMLTGDKSELDEKTGQSYRDSGLSHTMAVSGAHVACLLAPIFFICKKAGIENRKYYPVLIALLVFFAVLTGLKPSVCRACIVAGVMLAAGMWGKDVEALNSLSFSCLALVALNPYAIYDAGFILSYVCVLSILVFYGPIQKFIGRGPVQRLIALTVSVQIGVWPACAVLFHTFQAMSLPANILIFPARAAVSIGGWAMYILSLVMPPAAQALSYPVSFLVGCISSTADLFSSTGFSVINIPRLPVWFTGVYYAAIISLLYLKTKGVAVFSGAAAVLAAYMAFCPTPSNTCVFFDAGQADCHLVKTDKRGDMLIDTGEYALSGPIAHFAGDYIDAVFITHAHNDHAGGLSAILERFRVGTVYVPGCAGADTGGIKSICRENDVKCTELTAGDRLKIDGYDIEVLHPEPNRYLSLNDTSLVLKLEYGGHGMLFCGDIEQAAEADMLDRGENLEADVLKVPHHGSKTSASKDFLDRVSAEIAIIPCGRNVFGHPAQQMLGALGEARVYRTDLDGAVTVKIGKDEYKVETAVR